MAPRESSTNRRPSFSLGPRSDPGAFREAWDLLAFSILVAVLFNLTFPYGIELRVAPPKATALMDHLKAASPGPDRPVFTGSPIKASPSPLPSKPGDLLPRLSLAGAKARFDAGRSLFLDARTKEDYVKGHIPGALNFYAEEFDLHAPKVLPRLTDRGQELIAYCTGASCELSIHLAARLKELGYGNVKVFFGGWPEWTGAGYPVREGETP